MPENLSNIIIIALFLGVGLLAAIRLLAKRLAPVRTIAAVVADKHKTEVFSKYTGNGKHIKYAVVFSAGGKKLSFYVSEFSYGGYRVGEKGTLTYKGNRIIDFK